jgi:hypothetical protein
MSFAVFKARKRYFPPQKPTPRAAFFKSLIFQGFAPARPKARTHTPGAGPIRLCAA